MFAIKCDVCNVIPGIQLSTSSNEIFGMNEVYSMDKVEELLQNIDMENIAQHNSSPIFSDKKVPKICITQQSKSTKITTLIASTKNSRKYIKTVSEIFGSMDIAKEM